MDSAGAHLRIVSARNDAQEADEVLMSAFGRGDKAAFTQLYARFQSPVYNYILRGCGVPAIAAELTQETWLALVRNRESYRPSARFSAYLFHIAHNKLIDHWRSTPSGRQSLDDELQEPAASTNWQPEVIAESRENLERFLAAIEKLPFVQREAFLLQQEGGFDINEIAQITGVGRETAKSRLRYALAKLREELNND